MRLKPLTIALVAANLISLPLWAAEDAAQDSDKKAKDDGKVTVTATKRETDLMDTPIAVSVFSEDDLAKQGIKNVKDMNNIVPTMSIMTDYESMAPIITLRGVRSTNTTEWGDPAVGLHLDGVYSPRPQGANMMMFDIERAEVLRGPQGTLFGRNSTVGSLNIISAKPRTDKVLSSISVETGRWNQRALKGMLNLPVTDDFAIRFAYVQEERDSNFKGYWDPNQWDQRYLGFIDRNTLVPAENNYTTAPATRTWELTVPFADTYYQEVAADPSNFYNNIDNYGFRVSAYWTPSNDFSWLLAFEKYNDNGAGGILGRDCERIRNRPVEVNGGSCTDIWGTENNFTAYVNVPGHNNLVMDSARSRLEWDFTEDMQLVYLSGFQSQERNGQMDLDQGLYAWDQMLKWVYTDYDSHSHEFNLKSTDDGPLQWIAGYFYFKEQNDMNGQYHGAMGGVSLWRQPRREVRSEAIFGQLTYEISDRTFLTLGMRNTDDSKRDIGGRNYGCWGPCYVADAWGTVDWGRVWGDPTYNHSWQREALNALPSNYYDWPNRSLADWQLDSVNDVEESWSNTSFRIGLDHELEDGSLLYFYVADGYKNGGIGDVLIRQSDGERFDTSYDAETVTNYEIGYKTEFLDGDLQFQANYFYSDYKDQQFTQWTIYDSIDVVEIDPVTGLPVNTVQDIGTFLTRNAAESSIQGLEIEFNWKPWENGNISGWVSFLKATIESDYYKNWGVEIGQIFNQVDGAHSQDMQLDANGNVDTANLKPWQRNLKGNDLPYTPNTSLTVNMSHTFEFDSGATLTPFLTVHWEDESYVDLDNRDKWRFNEADLQTRNVDGVDVSMANYLGAYSDKRDAWAMATFNINFTSADKSWFTEGYIYNLTDEDVNWWQGYAGTTPMASKAQRSYGLRFGYNF